MKTLLTILSFLICFSLSANEGYNVVYTNVIKLAKMQDQSARNNIVAELKKLPADKKVLRFIGGGYSDGLGYLPEYVNYFIKFCKDGGVQEVLLRVEVEDFETGLQHYKAITEAGIKIKYIDFGNEDYFDVRPKNPIESFLYRFGGYKADRFKKAANHYANKFNQFVEFTNAKGHPEIAKKLSWSTHYKVDAGTMAWHNTLKNRLKSKGYNNCTLHIYGNSKQENYFERTSNLIKKNFQGLDLIVTEYHGLGFHMLSKEEKNKVHLSEKHAQMDKQIHQMMDDLGVKVRLMHVLFLIGDYSTYYAAIVVNKENGKTNSEVMRKIVKGQQ